MDREPTPKRSLERMNLALTAITLLALVGGWLWWGGRFSARVDSLEASRTAELTAQEQKRDIDSTQAAQISALNAQFAMIGTQLNRIESKVDIRR